MTVVLRAPGPAYENLQGRKPRVGSTQRRRGRRGGYGDWSAAAVGLDCGYNFNVTAWILLNGDFDSRPLCDFKELGVAKISHAAPRRLWPSQRRRAGRGDAVGALSLRADVALMTIPSTAN